MYAVGVDLGATNVRAVVGDERMTIVGSARTTTPKGPTGEAITRAVLDVVREACHDAAVAPSSITGAGIGSMGVVDRTNGSVRLSANLTDGIGPIPLVQPLAELLEIDTVVLHNDTVTGAIGERHHTHSDVDSLVYLTMSSGIGAGVISNGTLLLGSDGNAGEVGHMTIDEAGRLPCGCGSAGHWEAYCSGTSIPRLARTLFDQEPVETSLPLECDEFAAEHVFAHAGTDAFATRVVDRIAELNVLGMANLINAYAPDVVSVGGAVALNNPKRVLDPIRDRIGDEVVVTVPEIAVSELGERAVLYGALVSAFADDLEP